MMTSSNSIDFDNACKFQCHNRNQHRKLPLHANFQPPASVSEQNSGNFMFKMMTSPNSTNFVGWYKFQYNNQNQHHKLPLSSIFQFHASSCYQDKGNFMFS